MLTKLEIIDAVNSMDEPIEFDALVDRILLINNNSFQNFDKNTDEYYYQYPDEEALKSELHRRVQDIGDESKFVSSEDVFTVLREKYGFRKIS